MKKISILLGLWGMGLFLIAQNTTTPITISSDLKLTPVSEGVYMHTVWTSSPKYGRFPSNGLVIIKNKKAILVDTPMDDANTRLLCQYLKDTFGAEVVKVIVGHYHEDCIGGLNYIHNQDITSIGLKKTKIICAEQQLPTPIISFTKKKTFYFEGEKVICQYFGGGHTIDNIVVYFPERKVLFGGCLIKSLQSQGLGNTTDAVIEEWDSTINKLKATFTDIRFVIPGHGSFGNADLLDHTIRLVQDYKANKEKGKR
ncbi:subclass B1 metallo-beta-lactamase [Marinilabiliaceae bacterium JC017]|nr:subclass B1 metallo-beta-lactamase [Marinilabiliaceae bacterium JC017]